MSELTKFEHYTKLFPMLTFWEDTSQRSVKEEPYQHQQRVVERAEVRRLYRKSVNLKNQERGGFKNGK